MATAKHSHGRGYAENPLFLEISILTTSPCIRIISLTWTYSWLGEIRCCTRYLLLHQHFRSHTDHRYVDPRSTRNGVA